MRACLVPAARRTPSLRWLALVLAVLGAVLLALLARRRRRRRPDDGRFAGTARTARLLRRGRPLACRARHRPRRGAHQRPLRAAARSSAPARRPGRRASSGRGSSCSTAAGEVAHDRARACGCSTPRCTAPTSPSTDAARDVRRPRRRRASPRSPWPTRGRRVATGSGSRPATGSSSVPARPPGRRTASTSGRGTGGDSIRLPARDGCAIRGGYSGSPIVSRETGAVVGVANTGYVGGRRCIDSACEENRRGRVGWCGT